MPDNGTAATGETEPANGATPVLRPIAKVGITRRDTFVGVYARYINLVFIWFFEGAVPVPFDTTPLAVICATVLISNILLHTFLLLGGGHRWVTYAVLLIDPISILATIYVTGFLSSPFLIVLPLTMFAMYFTHYNIRQTIWYAAAVTLAFAAMFLLSWEHRPPLLPSWHAADYPAFTMLVFVVQLLTLAGFMKVSVMLPNPLREELAHQEHLLAQQQQDAELGASLAVIAHEIRTPLTIAGGRLEMLDVPVARLPGTEGVKAARYLEDVRTELKRIAGQLEGVMAYARKRQGQYRMQPQSPADLVARAADFFTLKYGRHRTRLATTVACPKRIAVTCDRDAVFQVLVNLLNNSVQARDPERRLELGLAAAAEDGHLRFTITDNGQGIPADKLARVFDREFSARDGGTGIGLFVSRQIIADHGGELTLQSVLGVGTTAVVRLPIAGPARDNGNLVGFTTGNGTRGRERARPVRPTRRSTKPV